jgi:hypothetical protein
MDTRTQLIELRRRNCSEGAEDVLAGTLLLGTEVWKCRCGRLARLERRLSFLAGL